MAQPSVRELCFVLKSMPYRERDKIVILFCEQKGRVTAIARNGTQSRRFGISLDLFNASDFELDSNTVRLSEMTLELTNEVGDQRLVQLGSATIRHTFPSLPKSIEKLSTASCLNELLLRALPNQKPVPEVFKLYSNTLTALDESSEDYSIAILNGFILKLSQWLGVQPALTRCMKCEKSLNDVRGDGVHPQFQTGGWVCVDCTGKENHSFSNQLSKNLILDSLHALLHPIRKIQWIAHSSEHLILLNFLEQHLMYFVPGLDRSPLTSIRFLKSTLQPFQK
jgi:DNA repair protein RecO